MPVVNLINSNLTQLQEVTFKSNGLMSSGIVNKTYKILKILGDHVRLRVAISFDGIGKNHDKIRNIEGIHNSALRTVKSLQSINDERLDVQANVAMGPYNIDSLEKTAHYLWKITPKISWFPVIVSERNFKNTEEDYRLLIDSSTKRKLVDFLKFLMTNESPSIGSFLLLSADKTF